jgi:hypothetical protein
LYGWSISIVVSPPTSSIASGPDPDLLYQAPR